MSETMCNEHDKQIEEDWKKLSPEAKNVYRLLLTPIDNPKQIDAEHDACFRYNPETKMIETTQYYDGLLDQDMSDIAVRFYEIMYGDIIDKDGNDPSLLEGTQFRNNAFAGDTMNSFNSIANQIPEAGKSKKQRTAPEKWPPELRIHCRHYHCLANFWILPMCVGRGGGKDYPEQYDKKKINQAYNNINRAFRKRELINKFLKYWVFPYYKEDNDKGNLFENCAKINSYFPSGETAYPSQYFDYFKKDNQDESIEYFLQTHYLLPKNKSEEEIDNAMNKIKNWKDKDAIQRIRSAWWCIEQRAMNIASDEGMCKKLSGEFASILETKEFKEMARPETFGELVKKQ